MGNRIAQIDRYHMWAPRATGMPEIAFRARRIRVQRLACRAILAYAELFCYKIQTKHMQESIH